MRRDANLGGLINDHIGDCKWFYKEDIPGLRDALRHHGYVRESAFTDEELDWHIGKILEALFHVDL